MPSRSVYDLVPECRQKCIDWLSLCAAEGLRVRITQTFRSQEEQNHLYELGRTLPGKVVTWTRNSRHTTRRAFDFVVLNDDGTANWEEEEYRRPGEIAESLGLEWGGRWQKADCPHIQLPDEKEVA